MSFHARLFDSCEHKSQQNVLHVQGNMYGRTSHPSTKSLLLTDNALPFKIFTARKRSMGQYFHKRGSLLLSGEGACVAGEHVWQVGVHGGGHA